jgi:trehalose 2-sulfotransferase
MALRYATNGPEFDFPCYPRSPAIRFVIATSPRCGSNLLQRALWRTGLAGAPEEYLTEAYANDFAQRWSIRVPGESGYDLKKYFGNLEKYRTSPNGVFGLKVHGSHLNNGFLSEVSLEDLMSKPLYILIRRRDKVLQAVSYALARKTGVWILDGEWLPEKEPMTRNPQYDYSLILDCLRDIETEEALWDTTFKKNHIVPFEISYEDLKQNYLEVIRNSLTHLGVKAPARTIIGPPGIRKQADSTNEEWATRFLKERQ